MSSKKQVSRLRQVVDLPKVDRRDPRFSAVSAGNVDMDLHEKGYSFLPEMLKEEYDSLRKELAAATKAERTCARRDKDAWGVEKERLERLVAQTRTRLERTERESRERHVLSLAKKEEREKRASGKGAWYMKKSEYTFPLSLISRCPTRPLAQIQIRRVGGARRKDGGQAGDGQEEKEDCRQGEEVQTDVAHHNVSCIHTPRNDLSTTLSSSTLHALLGDLGRSGRSSSLVGLLFSLLSLGLGDGSLSGSSSNLGLRLSFGEDGSKIGTNNSSLYSQPCTCGPNPPGP